MRVEETQELIQQCKEQTDLKIIANMMGPGEDLEGWAKLGRMLEEAGADMLELNMSLPQPRPDGQADGHRRGARAGRHASARTRSSPAGCCKAVVDAVKIPVMAEDDARGQHHDGVADRCEKNGAAAVSAINCPQSLPPLDIDNGGRPLYPSTGNQSFAGLCGPWIRPLAYRHVAQMRTICPDLPIAGGGGLMNWRHSVEMIMYGATVLTYCSLLYLKGYKAFAKIEPGLRKFMDEHGYETLADMRGIALKYIVTPGRGRLHPDAAGHRPREVQRLRHLRRSRTLRVHRDRRQEGRARRSPTDCYSCAVCYFLCTREAITMKKAPIEQTRAGVAAAGAMTRRRKECGR